MVLLQVASTILRGEGHDADAPFLLLMRSAGYTNTIEFNEDSRAHDLRAHFVELSAWNFIKGLHKFFQWPYLWAVIANPDMPMVVRRSIDNRQRSIVRGE